MSLWLENFLLEAILKILSKFTRALFKVMLNFLGASKIEGLKK